MTCSYNYKKLLQFEKNNTHPVVVKHCAVGDSSITFQESQSTQNKEPESAAAKSWQRGRIRAGRGLSVVHDSWSSGSMLARWVNLSGTGQCRKQTRVQVTFSNKDEVIKLSPMFFTIGWGGGKCCGGLSGWVAPTICPVGPAQRILLQGCCKIVKSNILSLGSDRSW